MIYLCSQFLQPLRLPALSSQNTLRLVLGPRNFMGRNVKRSLTILKNQYSDEPDNKAKKHRLLLTTWGGDLTGSHGFPLPI